MPNDDQLTEQELENIEKAKHEQFVGWMQASNMKNLEGEYLRRLSQPGIIPLLFSLRPDNGPTFVGPKRLGMLRAIWRDHQVVLEMAGYNSVEIRAELLRNTSA